MTTTAVDLGGATLAEALERVGANGDVIVIHESPDELARVRAACREANVFFMLGTPDVLPLPDASVDVVLGADGEDVDRVLRR
ncbi:MAG: methyltransferase domain-containing protein [Gaiellaceae bacterium]